VRHEPTQARCLLPHRVRMPALPRLQIACTPLQVLRDCVGQKQHTHGLCSCALRFIVIVMQPLALVRSNRRPSSFKNLSVSSATIADGGRRAQPRAGEMASPFTVSEEQ